MARIRTIKPEFWTDEKLSLLDPLTRLVFLGLVSLADDYGRLIDNIKSLDGAIFPHTDDSARESLETLCKLSRILRYRSRAGQQLIQIVNWGNHQKVNHKGKEILPAPAKEDWIKPVAGQRPIDPPAKPRKRGSRDPQENNGKVSRTISTTNDLGPTTLPAAAVNWPAVGSVWASEHVAETSAPQFGGMFKDTVDRWGWDATFEGLKLWEESTRGKSRNLGFFLKDSVYWINLAKMPTVDPVTRQLTEKGRLALA